MDEKGDEQANNTNIQAKQKQSTWETSVGRMDDEGCRTYIYGLMTQRVSSMLKANQDLRVSKDTQNV
eukprot:jgi/Picsp_1/5971/NSC_03326-R1_---NA---